MLLPADADLPGPYCENTQVHSAHRPCPGLRPAEFISKPCSNLRCDRMCWVPPDLPPNAVPLCSADCAVAVMGDIVS